MKVRLHPEACFEALEAKFYIREDDPQEADRFVAALEDALAKIRIQPNLYAVFEQDFRKVRVGKFPYAVVYRIRGQEAQVISVMHLNRKPGYWKTRSFN